ncbi:MAG TPA: lipoyl synthase [Acidimicrobiia bacterium]|nr:lipoyl synthase [Acidimicrobiia bacterium]
MTTLRARWLGSVPYREGETLQRALHARSDDDYLLLLEHPHVYTLGSSAHLEHVLCDPASVGAELVAADRGGDVTYHGPGQLVGYPIVSLHEWRAGQRDVVAYVRALEDVLIAVCADFGVAAGRSPGYTGVWVGDEKIAAIGVRVSKGRTRHGFALNVAPDLSMFEHIVPCGIRDRGVTSLARLIGADAPSMEAVVDRAAARFAERFGHDVVERADVAWHRPERSDAVPIALTPKRPDWMRVRARFDGEFVALKQLVREQGLHTVCEEAGCPNIYECWSDRTATFMILGDRCTRACGFCLVDTRKPLAVDADEPRRVAEAVATLGLAHAVITCVARDDLPDGGASIFAATVDAIRDRVPECAVELLISDCKGDPSSLDTVFAARPEVLNHNIETVARLQRLARPSAGYARSLAVLARAKDAGLVTKSGIILGMGEKPDEVRTTLVDLRAVGVDLITIGQYLRPSASHLPVVKWWHPDEFAELRAFGESLGFAHVESGPLVRSSYHAREGAARMEPWLTPTS